MNSRGLRRPICWRHNPPVWRHKVCWQTFTQIIMLHTMQPSLFLGNSIWICYWWGLGGSTGLSQSGIMVNFSSTVFVGDLKNVNGCGVLRESSDKTTHKFLYANVVGAIFWVENTLATGGEATTTNALIGEWVGVPSSYWLTWRGLVAERNAIDLFFSCDL